MGARALAAGDLDYKVDVAALLPGQRRAGEDINSVALGISQVIRKSQYRSLAYTIEGLGK